MPKILLVDDEIDILEVLSELTARWGFTSKLASSVQQALDLLEEESFGLVLSDFSMPHGGGIGLLKQARAAGHRVPFIFLSGIAAPDLQEEAKVLGAFDFIDKPFDRERLKQAIEAALRK